MILLVQSPCLWFTLFATSRKYVVVSINMFFYRLNNHVSKLN